MKKHILFILSVILFASSCFAQQTATPAWQQIFPDPLLQTYINEALENNSDLRTAQLSLEQSEAMLKQARLSYLPGVALSPSGTVTKTQNTSATYTYELPLTMNWELSFGGKRHHQKAMAAAELQKDSAQLKYTQIQLVAEVANAYYTLVMLDQQYAVTLEGIRVQEENLRVLRAMKEVGQQTAAALGLHAAYTEHGTPYYEEANMVIECETMTAWHQTEQDFRNDTPKKRYDGFDAGIHTVYVGEVIGAWKR